MNLNIYAVGDIMLGEQQLCHNFGVKSIIKDKGPTYLFKHVRDILKDGDIIFGNLETPVSYLTNKRGLDANYFRGDPIIIEGLKNSHFNILSIANNHIMEHGRDSFQETVHLLKENNILAVGLFNKAEILVVKGFKVGFIAYSFIEDNIFDHLYNKINSKEKIIEDIKNIRDDVDILILSLHWGYEYTLYPSPEQVALGRELIDCGVDIIFGGHPHVIQSYEIYKGKPIVYSLGNFIFDHTYIENTCMSIITKLNIDMNDKSICIQIIPIVCDVQEYLPNVAINEMEHKINEIVLSIKNNIENKSIYDYSLVIGDYITLVNKYKKVAKNQMKLHFIKNFYRYPPALSVKIANSYIKKSLFKV